MIPSDELDRFAACAREAWSLAAQGCAADGYAVLDLGLIWAETPAVNPDTGVQSPPEPWAGELIARYRGELTRYIAEHRAGLGRTCLTREVQFTQADARELRATADSLCQDSVRLKQRADELAQRFPRLSPKDKPR